MKKGNILKNVIKVTSNIVIHQMQEGTSDRSVVVLANGNSLNVDENGRVTECDSLMRVPDMGIFSDDTKVIAVYYTFECLGIIEAHKEIANFVNETYDMNKELFIIGHSKSAVGMYSARNYINPNISYTLITVSPPYEGTIMVSPKAFKKAKKKYNSFFNLVHKLVYSDHNVDKDIAVGSNDLIKAQRGENLKSNVFYINVISDLQDTSMCKSYKDYFCFALDRCIYLLGDGIVSRESQVTKCDLEIVINAPHESSLALGLLKIKAEETHLHF